MPVIPGQELAVTAPAGALSINPAMLVATKKWVFIW